LRNISLTHKKSEEPFFLTRSLFTSFSLWLLTKQLPENGIIVALQKEAINKKRFVMGINRMKHVRDSFGIRLHRNERISWN